MRSHDACVLIPRFSLRVAAGGRRRARERASRVAGGGGAKTYLLDRLGRVRLVVR